MRISLQRSPRIVQRKMRYLLDRVAPFKKSVSRLVPQVVEMQIPDVEELASTSERGADRAWVIGEDVLVI